MARFVNKLKNDIGRAPDSLVFYGNKKVEKVDFQLFDYNQDTLIEKQLTQVAEIQEFIIKDTVTWLNVYGVHNPAIMEEIAQAFDLDKTILADVMNTEARPTFREYSNCIYISIKLLYFDNQNILIADNICLIITKSVLITFQEKSNRFFDPVRERIRNQKKRIRGMGTDYLAYALLDVLIDNYIYNLSLLGEDVEALEDKILTRQKAIQVDKINIYKREMNFMRKNIIPAKEIILALSKLDSDIVEHDTNIYYKELVDNLNHITEIFDSYKDMLSDQLNIYNTNMNNSLNETIKLLTVFSVIFIPLTFVVGVYGTNFNNVPEFNWFYGYYYMWGLLISIALGMLIYFKRKKWL
jgi:magnesium transporter